MKIGSPASLQRFFLARKIVLIVLAIAIAPFAFFYLLSTVYLFQGDQRLAEGKIESALDAYEMVLVFNSNSDRAYVKIGQALQTQKRYLEAFEAYTRAYTANPNLKLDPSESVNFLELGNALSREEHQIEAIESYQKAIAIEPAYSQAYFQLGRAFFTLRRWDSAATAWQKSIELDPHQPQAYFYLGESYRQQKLWEEARGAYQKALDLNPEKVEIYQKLGEVLQKLGKWSESADIYLQALTYTPKNGDLSNQLGKALAEQGKLPEAIAAYEQGLRNSPKNARIPENLCYAHLMLGEVDKGLKYCQQALTLDPNLGDARFILQEIQRGQAIHNNPTLLTLPESIPTSKIDPLVSLKRSIVKIIVRSRGRGAIGTGWLVKREGDRAWIVTNRHVVTNSRQEIAKNARIFVEFYSNPPAGQIRKRSKARLLHTADPKDWLDLAVLEIENPPADIQPLILARETISPTEPVLSIGNPFNKKDWTVTKGTVNDNTDKSLTLSMLVVAGQSGSPVFNSQNQVVGILSQSGLFCPNAPIPQSLETSVQLGCGLAIPVERIREKLSEWGVISSKK